MNEIFDIVYHSLKWLSKITKLTYEEVNVIIWFIILPAIFIALIDRILKSNYFKIGFSCIVLLALVLIPNFEDFSKQLFIKSAAFLHGFEVIGLNYTTASVLICVLLPLITIFMLIILKRRTKN